jgi:cyanate permease
MGVRRCWADPNFRLVMLCFGLGVSFFNALLTVSEQLTAPCGYSEAQGGVFGGLLVGTGIPAAVFAGVLMDRTHAYRPMLKCGYLLSLGAAVLFCAAQRPDNAPVLGLSYALLGASMLPLLPITIETCAELTYPVPEVYSSGLLLTAGTQAGRNAPA